MSLTDFGWASRAIAAASLAGNTSDPSGLETWCIVVKWFYTDTGDIIGYDVNCEADGNQRARGGSGSGQARQAWKSLTEAQCKAVRRAMSEQLVSPNEMCKHCMNRRWCTWTLWRLALVSLGNSHA